MSSRYIIKVVYLSNNIEHQHAIKEENIQTRRVINIIIPTGNNNSLIAL